MEIEVSDVKPEEQQKPTDSQGMLGMFTPSFDLRANVLGFGGTSGGSSWGQATPLLNQSSNASQATAQRSADARDKPAGGLGLHDDAEQRNSARSDVSVEREARPEERPGQEPAKQADQRITKPQEEKKKEQSLPELRRRMRNADDPNEKRTCEVPECTWQ